MSGDEFIIAGYGSGFTFKLWELRIIPGLDFTRMDYGDYLKRIQL
jgi:hypothetical protein